MKKELLTVKELAGGLRMSPQLIQWAIKAEIPVPLFRYFLAVAPGYTRSHLDTSD